VHKVTHAWKRNPWADHDELLHMCRAPWHNHLCKRLWLSLTGYVTACTEEYKQRHSQSSCYNLSQITRHRLHPTWLENCKCNSIVQKREQVSGRKLPSCWGVRECFLASPFTCILALTTLRVCDFIVSIPISLDFPYVFMLQFSWYYTKSEWHYCVMNIFSCCWH